MTFFEALDITLRSSLPVLVVALTFLAASLTISSTNSPTTASKGLFGWGGNATETAIDFTKNDLLLGSRDPIFWFLVPLFSLISVGICVCINYAALGLTNLFYFPYKFLTARPSWVRVEDVRYDYFHVISWCMLTIIVGEPLLRPLHPAPLEDE